MPFLFLYKRFKEIARLSQDLDNESYRGFQADCLEFLDLLRNQLERAIDGSLRKAERINMNLCLTTKFTRPFPVSASAFEISITGIENFFSFVGYMISKNGA